MSGEFNVQAPAHQLNCALLIPRKSRTEVPHVCTCGAERPRSLDDVSGEEWNAASRAYRDKIASPKFPGYSMLDEHYGQDHDKPAEAPLVASGSWEVSQGETRTVSSTGGQKGVKQARFGLIPSEALALVAEHYGKGAEKYEVHNWRKGYEWSKSYDAMQRHLHAFWSGENLDPETDSPHLAAVVFHALTLLTFTQEQPQFDDRYRQED